MISEQRRQNILQRYTTPGEEEAFSGRTTTARKYNLNEDEANKELLSYNYSYGLHREYKKPRKHNPYFAYYPREQIQCDLIDIQKLSPYNDDIKFILVCIDIFTRKAWVRGLKTKQGKETATNFKSILDEMDPIFPKSILFDRGSEFLNIHMNQLLQEKKIKTILPGSYIKAAYAERFNRTLQKLIYKYMTERQTHRYIDVLQNLCKTYNIRGHRSLNGLSPLQAERTENIDKIRSIQINNRKTTILKGRHMKPQFKIGDVVRIQKEKGVFDRGYKETSSPEYFEIVNINHRLPIITYTIRSLNKNDIIIGGYYANELQLVRGNTYKIEKVLKRRTRKGVKELFVKWLDFDSEHNSWIPETDILN